MRHCEKCGGTLFDADECVVCTLYDLRARFAAAEKEREAHHEAAVLMRADLDVAHNAQFELMGEVIDLLEALKAKLAAAEERARVLESHLAGVEELEALNEEGYERKIAELKERVRKVADERTAQIVTWLRNIAGFYPNARLDAALHYADAIERGDYHS